MYRVVIADDEAEFRGWLRSLLESDGEFEIVGEASTGVETIGLVKSLTPDVVIADVYMPDSDGLEVARCLRSLFPGSKMILVSSQEERLYQRLAREEGALAFIPKGRLSLNALHQTLLAVGQR